MKKMMLGLAILAGVAAVPAMSLLAEDKPAAEAKASEAPAGFESLFNGKDLTNWKGKDGFWSVQDGAITGEPCLHKPASFFINSAAGDFENWVMVDVWDFLTQNFPIRPERGA